MPNELRGRRKALSVASRIAIGAMMLGGASVAHAQDDADVSSDDRLAIESVDTAGSDIVVTGSRIGGVAPVGSVVTSLGRSDIESAGVVNAVQLLQQLPQIPSLGVGQSQRYGGGGTYNRTFVSGINIRGVGPYATLTLVNGRRAIPQGPAGIAVDPTMIPTLALQRIDVIADGASAIYGSDAVAGVVNLITRRGYEGLEVYGRYGDGADYHEYNMGAIAGTTWSTGQFTVAYEHGYTSALNGMDRDFYGADLRARGGADYRVTTCNPGTMVVGGVTYALPAGGLNSGNVAQLVPGTSNKCDIFKVSDMVPAQRYNTGIFNFDQELGSGVSVFFDGFAYSRRGERKYTLATNANVVVPSSNPYFVAPVGTNPSSVVVQYAYGDGWPQSYTMGKSKGFQLTGGIEVDLFSDWSVAADYSYGRTWDVNDDVNVIYAPAVTAALNSTNPATAFNPFGGANDPNVVKEITSGGGYSEGSNTLHFAQLSAAGTLFTLPGGNVKAAIGYEHHVAKMDFLADTSRKRGAYVLVGTPRTRKINSFYGEIQVPIFSDQNSVPGFYSLELNAALRHDDYNDVGSTTNPKFGINWNPVEDLKLRASYGTSFRAPLLVQVYGAVSNIYIQNYTDPECGGCLIPGIAQAGPNLNLKPETATTWSAGFDFTPAALDGLKLSATYFDIEYKGQITEVISNLAILSIADYYAGTGIIVRNPSPEFVAKAVSETNGIAGGAPLPNPVPLYIDGRSNNLGTSIMRGIDFEAAYQLHTENSGTFGFSFGGTYLTTFKSAQAQNAPMIDQRNTIMNPLKFRARASFSWTYDKFDITTFVNHQGGYDNNLVNPVQKVGSYTTVDLYAGVAFDVLEGTKLGVNVRNLFNTKPPFVDLIPGPWGGGGGYDATASNPIGRVISLQLTSKLF